MARPTIQRVLSGVIAVAIAVAGSIDVPAAAQSGGFSETFNGAPAAAAPWQPSNWGADANNSDMWGNDGQSMTDPVAASHDPSCGSPPGTHTIQLLKDAIFQCSDHIMTAMNAGYGAIYLTPPAMIDVSTGEAVLHFDVSTFRTVGRDWIDLWVTPFGDQFAVPLNGWLPPYQGEPRRAVQLKMEGSSRFEAYRYDAGHRSTEAKLPVANFAPYETVLTTSAARRDTFELRLSKTHVKFGMPAYNLWWVDTAISPALDWSSGVIQIAQHAYNPMKDCTGACANTWHWDNVNVSPSLPLTVIPMSPRWSVARKNGSDTLTLSQPAPQNAWLRFAAVGANIDLSFNGGTTWTRANYQPSDRHAPEHFSSYLVPITAGATTVKVRATGDSYVGTWMVANANVISQGAGGPPPPPTPTPGPTNTPGPTATATATPLPGAVTVTFDDRAGQNQPLNGQYPTGLIDWGTNAWYHSGPFGAFTTKSASFVAGPVSASFSFLQPRKLTSLRAYNGGTGPSTVTLACAGQTTKSQIVPAGQLASIATGWTAPCSPVVIGSSNGWDTNVDDLGVSP